MSRLVRRLWVSPTFTTWGSLATRLCAVLLILPLVLTRFSPAEVAVWQLFASISTLVLLFDFGLAPTFARLLAYARAGARLDQMADMRAKPFASVDSAGTPESLAHVVATMHWLYPRIAAGVVLLVGLLATVALRPAIAQLNDPDSAWLAWATVLAGTIFGFRANAYAAALQGLNSIAPLRRWETATGLCQLLTSFGVVVSGGGLLALVCTYQSWVVLGYFRNRALFRALHPELVVFNAACDPRVLRIMWPAAWRSGVGILMSQGIISASGIVYSQFSPAAEVASYLLALRVITTISQFSQAPFYSKLPSLAELYVTGKTQNQVSLAQRGMRYSHWIFVLAALLVTQTIGSVLSAIGSQTPFVDPSVWLALVAAFFVERYGAMHLQLYSLTNHILWHIANGVTGLLMIGLSVLLYPALHILAFPVAMLVAYAGYYSVFSARKSVRQLKVPLLVFEKNAALRPAFFLFAGLACYLFLVSY